MSANAYLIPVDRSHVNRNGERITYRYYVCKFRDLDGQWHQKSFGRNKRRAESEFAKFLRGLAKLRNDPKLAPSPSDVPTIADVCAHYLEHARDYYRTPEGATTSMLDRARAVTLTIIDLVGELPASSIGPAILADIREQWIAAGLAYSTINEYMATTKRIIKWAFATERIPRRYAAALPAILAVSAEQRRRTRARVPKPRTPVTLENVQAIRQHVAPQVYALAMLQYWTAARSGELVQLKPEMIDTTADVWTVTITSHKTAHHEQTRTLYLGPRAQEILRPWLERTPPGQYLFDPREGLRARKRIDAAGARRPNQRPNPRKTRRTIGDRYTPNAYRHAIARGCELAGIEKWTPHQLRHAAATRLNDKYGIQAAQDVLEHTTPNVTALYTQARRQRAIEIMRTEG